MKYKGESDNLNNAHRKPTLQAFMSKPMAAALNLSLALTIVNGYSAQGALGLKAPSSNAAIMQSVQKQPSSEHA